METRELATYHFYDYRQNGDEQGCVPPRSALTVPPAWGTCIITTAGYTTAGYTTAGYTAAGYTTAGYITAGYTTAGYTTAGYTTAGYTTAGYTTAGYTTAGYITAGYTTAGYTTACYTTAGYTTAGYTTVGYTTAGNTTAMNKYFKFLSLFPHNFTPPFPSSKAAVDSEKLVTQVQHGHCPLAYGVDMDTALVEGPILA
ncbi:hypothetical protein Btru_005377 [Bulinus truncatus]|nr:hypothetical protein Btru_005377 [Bulinus truncatus]